MPHDTFRAATVQADLEVAMADAAWVRDTAHPLSRYVDWLVRVNSELARSGVVKHVYICEQLIGRLRERIAEESKRQHPTEVVRQGIGGVRSLLRAVRAGAVELDDELVAELAELAREVGESVPGRRVRTEPLAPVSGTVDVP